MQTTPVVWETKRDSDANSSEMPKRSHYFTRQVAPGSRGFEVLSFTGSAIINDRYTASAEDAQAALNDVKNASRLKEIVSESRGSFTACLLNTTSGDVYLVNDPLGGGILFRYTSGDHVAYGSDLNSLRLAIELEGSHLRRDPLFELSGFATGTQCYASDTPFYEIEVLPPGMVVKVPANSGSVIQKSTTLPWEYESKQSFDELVEAAVSTVASNVACAAAYGEDTITDLTGGFDSRLVLAAITNQRLNNHVALSSIHGNPEWKYAEGLAKATGMTITKWRGLTNQGEHTPAPLENYVAGARRSGGLIRNELGPYSSRTPVVNFQGGYGETFRAFNNAYVPNDTDPDYTNIFSSMWEWARISKLTVQGEQLFSKSALEVLAQRASRYLVPGKTSRIPNEHLTSYLYLVGRNRYWIGQKSHHAAHVQSRFDPLYNQYAIRAAFQLDFWERKSNLVGLRMMQLLDSELLSFPFHNRGVITERFEKRFGRVPRRDFPLGRVNIVEHPYKETGRRPFTLNTMAERQRVQTFGEKTLEYILSNPEVRALFNASALTNLLTAPSDANQVTAADQVIGTQVRSGLMNDQLNNGVDRFIFK